MRVPRGNVLTSGNAFHKIWRCHNREFLLQDHGEKHAYLRCIHDDYQKKCTKDDFVIFSYALMSNHCHEASQLKNSLTAFSGHMRRAHGLFGLRFNKRHQRLGKVAHDRPKTLKLEGDEDLMTLMFYIDCNPVRAGINAEPTDIRWKDFSSCRFYCFGEKNRYSNMLTLPNWYLGLGKTARQRQRKYRSLLDQYLVQEGLKRNPKMSRGHFIGGQLWTDGMKKKLAVILKKISKPPPK